MKQERNQEQVEEKIRTAVDHAAPVYSEELHERAARLTATPQKPQRRRRPHALVAAVAAIAACAVLAVGVLGIVRANAAPQGTAVVVFDVNPSIQLTIDQDERVISVVARNEDAARLLDGMDLSGVQLNVAVNALIGSLLKNGYINELANSILISVEGDDQQSAAALQQRLSAEIDALLAGFGIEGAILSQTLAADDSIDTLAATYDISRGKAALIQELLAQNTTLRAEDLAGLTINALSLLLAEPQTDNISRTGTASDGSYIGTEAATTAALAHAGVSQADAQRLIVEMDVEDGRMVYEVEFYASDLEYEYDVDAVSGEIVKFSSEGRYNAAQGGAATGTDIGRDAALAAALAHAGLKEADVTGVRVESDREDGRAIYEIEFYAGNVEYDYDIDAATGAVLKQSKETHSTSAGGTTGGTTGTDIGRDAALAAALAHAGLKEADVTGVRVESDREDGRAIYEIDFYAGNVEYDYDIDAATGKVIEYSKETKGGTTGNTTGSTTGTDIGASKAKSIALSHAGVSSSDAYDMKAERDRDNGVTVYEVEFKAGGYEYEYEINASTGEILGHSREYDD